MQVTYQAETHKWQGNGGDFLITNLNPVQYQEEKQYEIIVDFLRRLRK